METVNGCLSDRLDEMEAAIRKTSFRKGTGRANEVNYWVFDYPPEKELEVRARIEYMKGKNARGDDDFDLVVFDLYDVIIGFLEKKRFLEKCYDFEKKNGMERITKAVTNAMKINDNDSLDHCFIFQGQFFHFCPVDRNREVEDNLSDPVAIRLLFRE